MARKPLFLRSIFLKFSISFIIIGLIPLLFFSFIAIDTFSKNIEEVTIHSQEQLLGYAGENIGKLIAGYNDLTKLVYTYNSDSYGEPLNNLLKRAAETHSKSISAIQSTLAINDFVRSLLYTDAYIQNVIFIDERMRAYDASQMSKVFNTDYDFYNKGRLKYIIQNRNQLTILPSHKAEYYKGSSELVISFARNFYDLSQIESHKILGTIQIDVDVNTFDTVFNHLTTQSEDEIYLVDNDGYCIYSNLREKIAKNMGWFQQKKTKFTNKNFTGYFLDEQVYYIYSKVPTQNWVIIRKIYQKDILNKVQGIRNFLKIIITVCSMGLILVAIVFSRRFSIPVQRMLRQMKKVERGDLNSRVTINSQDEMGQLAEGFNNMVCELQRYIAKSYLAQNKQKEAELNALKTEDFIRILTEPDSSLTTQYSALLATEEVKLEFKPDGIEKLANLAWHINERTENIGARRLHTVIEKLLEDISFRASELRGTTAVIDGPYVEKQIGALCKDDDLSRFIL